MSIVSLEPISLKVVNLITDPLNAGDVRSTNLHGEVKGKKLKVDISLVRESQMEDAKQVIVFLYAINATKN